MAATLTANGITFGDSTQLNSKYGIMAQGTVSVFYEANAPVGWAKSTTQNNKALRVVTGTTGGTAGGTLAFTSAFPSSLKAFNVTVTVTDTLGGTTLSPTQMPSHTHPGSSIGPQGVNHNHSYTRTVLSPAPSGGTSNRAFHSTVATTPNGAHTHGFAVNQSSPGGGSHTHSWAGSGPASDSVDTRVKYIDVIICSLT
jgi:hypothetical protein